MPKKIWQKIAARHVLACFASSSCAVRIHHGRHATRNWPPPLLLQKRAFRLTGRFRTPYNRGTHGGKVSYPAANTQWIYLPIVARIKQGRLRSPRLDVSL
jgi:hypothetical protein